MGGHGGLNILPQKRWNVYNFDNREKVRKDEEAAAKEEQLKREQSRKRDTEVRLEQLRQARGHASSSSSAAAAAESAEAKSKHISSFDGVSVSDPFKVVNKEKAESAEAKSKHINLFEGIRVFDPVEAVKMEKGELGREFKRMKKEAEAPKVVLPEDEKYRLGYGVAGKGVKLPWYMEKRRGGEGSGDDDDSDGEVGRVKKSSGKKSLEELREERLKREGREKGRERALLLQKGRHRALAQNDRGVSRRR